MGVRHYGCRSPQSRPPSRPPPAGGRRRGGKSPLGGGEEEGNPRWGEEKRREIPAGGRRRGDDPRWGEETFPRPQRGRAGVGVCLSPPAGAGWGGGVSLAPSGGGLGWGCVSRPQRGRAGVGVCLPPPAGAGWGWGCAPDSLPHAGAGEGWACSVWLPCTLFPPPSRPPPAGGYALPPCHAASGWAASAPRGAGFQPTCRHPRRRWQVLDVTPGAQAGSLRHSEIGAVDERRSGQPGYGYCIAARGDWAGGVSSPQRGEVGRGVGIEVSGSHLEHAHPHSPAPLPMHYPHVALRQAGCKCSPWRRLPAHVQASSPPPAGAGRGRWCAGTNLV
ncbi:MAG: hypothetical protein KatS3mg056_1603 [Chloroflexus sp.]|nr:MAG: hypothetical protein KatS3mg056_1603 [Chloroflexus sp.]